MNTETLRTAGCFLFAALLVTIGTFAAGVLPRTTLFQVIAGAVIVAGFASLYFCFD